MDAQVYTANLLEEVEYDRIELLKNKDTYIQNWEQYLMAVLDNPSIPYVVKREAIFKYAFFHASKTPQEWGLKNFLAEDLVTLIGLSRFDMSLTKAVLKNLHLNEDVVEEILIFGGGDKICRTYLVENMPLVQLTLSLCSRIYSLKVIDSNLISDETLAKIVIRATGLSKEEIVGIPDAYLIKTYLTAS